MATVPQLYGRTEGRTDGQLARIYPLRIKVNDVSLTILTNRSKRLLTVTCNCTQFIFKLKVVVLFRDSYSDSEGHLTLSSAAAV